MKLHRMELGFNGTNSYLVSDQDSTFIIDPGADGEKILAFIQEKTWKWIRLSLPMGTLIILERWLIYRKNRGKAVYTFRR